MFGWLLMGLIIGGAAAALVYTVSEWINRNNIGSLIKKALRTAQSDAAKKMLGRAIQTRIKSKKVNEISIDAIDEDTGDIIEIQLNTTAGIDDSIRVNDVYTLVA